MNQLAYIGIGLIVVVALFNVKRWMASRDTRTLRRRLYHDGGTTDAVAVDSASSDIAYRNGSHSRHLDGNGSDGGHGSDGGGGDGGGGGGD